jgi:hypothetical protein
MMMLQAQMNPLRFVNHSPYSEDIGGDRPLLQAAIASVVKLLPVLHNSLGWSMRFDHPTRYKPSSSQNSFNTTLLPVDYNHPDRNYHPLFWFKCTKTASKIERRFTFATLHLDSSYSEISKILEIIQVFKRVCFTLDGF